MCLIAFNWKNHPQYKLILIANRDEFYQRKTKAAHFWEENPAVLAGKDLEAGGTWMGISREGKFSALTNYRDLKNLKSNAPSRGHLTSSFLSSSATPQIYLQSIAPDSSAYNGFNLLVGTTEQLYYFSNYQNQIRELSSGLYGLSNHLLDTEWYKVQKIKMKFGEAIQKNQLDPNTLLELLFDTQKPADEQVQQTGLPLEKERMLSSMFIQSPDYGTCCSTVLLMDYENKISFTERFYNTPDKVISQNTFQIHIERSDTKI